MASGHVNRINRPNTWPHRPSLRREEIPCQLGAVHTWGYSDRSIYAVRRRLRGVQNTGRVHGDAVIYWVAYCEL